MKVLVIGGNRFLGVELTARLLARGDDVTLLNRGTLVDPFGERVKRLRADRGTADFDAALVGTRWDVVFDFALFDGPQTERLIRVIDAQHVVVISTGQVYLVRTPRPAIARESDFEGVILPAAPTPEEEPDYRYGIEKREVESRLAASGLPHTIFRLPMVHGGRDQKQRFGRLLWNLVERKPILLRAPDAPVRQVFSGAVVDALLASSIRGPSRAAWNLAWSDEVTSGELVDAAARSLGTTAVIRPEQTATTDECFLNSKWMSALDASAARRDLAFTHPPLDGWLAQLTHAWLSRL